MRRALLLLAPLLIAAAPARLALRAQPGTVLDRDARLLAADDLADARRAGERPLVLVAAVNLHDTHDRPALFVQLQSPRQCGSGGCSTTAYYYGPHGWTKILDSAAGAITILPTRHHGFADLQAGHEHYVWTGAAYADTRPAPTLSLTPHWPLKRSPRARPAPHPTSVPAHTAPAPRA